MYPPPQTDDVNELRLWCEEFYDYMIRIGDTHRWWEDISGTTWQDLIDISGN